MTVLERAASAEGVGDIVLPFAVESLSTRGRLVRLGPAIDQLLKRHDYPEAVSKLVAEAVTLAALLGSTLKTSGRFQLQTKSDGPVTMLLVDFDAPSHLRGLARFDRERLKSGRTAGGAAWRAGGLVVQYLPGEGGRRLQADFPPGDAPEGVEPHTITEDDAWTEAKTRAATTEAHELIAPTRSSEGLLFRLFNERGVRVYASTPLAAVGRCSAEGVDAMLRSFPPEEVREMVGDDGLIGVTCEFCSTKRTFNPADYGA